MDSPRMEHYTYHARKRMSDRRIPEYVIDYFEAGRAFIAQGRKVNNIVSNYHIVRVSKDEFVVGIEREDNVVTLIRVDKAYTWFKNRLFNFKHMYRQIRALPILYSPELKREAVERSTAKSRRRDKQLREITEELFDVFGVKS